MTTIVLFHHAQGLTPGISELGRKIGGRGHVVHTPDYFEGRTFDNILEGYAYVQERGFDSYDQWAEQKVAELPTDAVYIGVSLGVRAAQRLAQTRSGARGAILIEACLPPDEFGTQWPDEVPVQIHGAQDDPLFALEGDLQAAQALIEAHAATDLHTYPGDKHLFCDSSLPGYDAEATDLLVERVRSFVSRV
ncbi:dienelactone hydrolase family protein [Gephyromycinifex aptenodytis]|uniref:dienelactone hydrolase family protein n=1 Tax=Gephyromycinifex aptenodytis TaxID=2716227 RepID=UPI00144844E5|nr:dienelactone hydrolase family protein [Gephyromycinifex aptenodytis]